MRSLISTPNILRAGQGLPLSNASLQKSNNELVTALRYAFSTGNKSLTNQNNQPPQPQSPQNGPDPTSCKLKDEASEYEITAKIFFTQECKGKCRGEAVEEALQAVNRSLGTDSVDLYILSFPGIALDADDTDAFDDNELADIIQAYRIGADLQSRGSTRALGIAEFSARKLEQLCDAATQASLTQPHVNQINLKDCCVMPRDLVQFAKGRGIKLYTHGDASDMLPAATLNDLLAEYKLSEDKHWLPRWVCKFTAVVKSRGVVESKGYVVSIHDDTV
ncbi:hypothetical protein PYCC9005_005071 [Savitreella phatthalungensis]